MKIQFIIGIFLFFVVGAFAQNNRTSLSAAKQQMTDAKSYNISLVWQDEKEIDRNPGIKKEVLNIFPELANKELNQKNPDFTIQILVAKAQIIAEKNTTALATNNGQLHEVELNYELPVTLKVLNNQGQLLFQSKLNELQNPMVFKEYYKYTDNNGSIGYNPKTNEPYQVRGSVKGYDRLNSGVSSTDYYAISTKKQTTDLRSLLKAWQMNLNN